MCILARAPGGQMRGAATQAMPVCIVEERQQSRYAPLPPRPSGLRPAGPLAVLLAPYIPHRVCSSLAPCQRAWGPAAKCTPYFLTGPWPPISQIRRKDLPQISRITRVFEFFGPLAVWLQIKPIVRQKGGSFRLIRGQASFGFLVGKRFVILRVFASSR